MIVRRLSFVPPNPLETWTRLHPHPRLGFILGSAAGTANDHLIYLSAGEPSRVSRAGESSSRSFFEKLARQSRAASPVDMPRWVGFFGFESGRWFDPGIERLPRLKNPLQTPTAFFAEFKNVVKFDLKKNETTIVAENKQQAKRIQKFLTNIPPPAGGGQEGGGQRSHRLAPPLPPPLTGRGKNIKGDLHSGFFYKSENEFSLMVREAKSRIVSGDIYQANLSLRFKRKFAGDPLDLYRELCTKNPSPYAALLKMNDEWLVSTSPELLVAVKGRQVWTRPIAGTRPRGKNSQEDRRKRGQLLLSPKERAEHIMLVDLERNDLGRICRPGSVKVTDRFAIERYSHVMHIVSEVEGKLKKNETALSALAALFPGGTITGCPKIKSIEIINELEGEARGPFYGSAGFISWNGDAIFNILIRTALIKNNSVVVQAGAGIVADSHPAREYKEALAKARALLEAVTEISG